MEAADPGQDQVSAPSAVLDGGEEEWDVLVPAVERTVSRVAPGDVLEIVSHNPSSRVAVPIWCLLRSHELLSMVVDGSCTSYLVRRGEQPA